MNYWARKDELSKMSQRHVEKMFQKFPDEIRHSVNRSEFYMEEDMSKLSESLIMRVYAPSVTLEVDSCGTNEYIFKMKNKDRICILNFASFKNPCGKFFDGSFAQEEALCHVSTLPCILPQFNSTYYFKNRQNTNDAIYYDRMIYTPDVLFYDDENGTIVKADVITCAAPNAGVAYKRGRSHADVYIALQTRINAIIESMYLHNINHAVIGPFGCGVFKNDTHEVSKLFAEAALKAGMKYYAPIPDEENRILFQNTWINYMWKKLEMSDIEENEEDE